MNRKEAEAYTTQAIEALELCKTEHEIVEWDGKFCNTVEYVALPDDLVAKLQWAYANKAAWIAGVGGG